MAWDAGGGNGTLSRVATEIEAVSVSVSVSAGEMAGSRLDWALSPLCSWDAGPAGIILWRNYFNAKK
jgi:hypothetical protein